MICLYPAREELFIEILGPRISLEMIIAHPVNNGLLNPYFLGRRELDCWP